MLRNLPISYLFYLIYKTYVLFDADSTELHEACCATNAYLAAG
jgi:hypothetical protein